MNKISDLIKALMEDEEIVDIPTLIAYIIAFIISTILVLTFCIGIIKLIMWIWTI